MLPIGLGETCYKIMRINGYSIIIIPFEYQPTW